jgi:hypothetical protein
VNEIDEILNFDFAECRQTFSQPCFLGMSVNDPLLDCNTTEEILRNKFEDLMVLKVGLPYHQPPSGMTFEDMMRDYGKFLDMLG